ncbi:YpmS family protein [Ligilactobacillus ceti]|nr:YpmS family protein [Ligilactobacillus ceti]
MTSENLSRTKQLKSPKQPRNYWKWAFTILVALIIASGVYVSWKVKQPNPAISQTTTSKKVTGKQAYVHVDLTKEDLNDLINQYLDKKKTGQLKYRVLIDKSIILQGATTFFGQKVAFTVDAQPEVAPDGNLILHTKKMAVGSLGLPQKYILNYVKNNYDLKKRVQIKPDQKEIILNLNQIAAEKNLSVKCEKFDLKTNQFKFKVGLPLGK